MNDELKRATLSQVLVGSNKDKLMVTSASQSVFNVCEEFGKYVKFVVEIGEQAAPLQSLIIFFNSIINNNLSPAWSSGISGDGKQVFYKSWPNIKQLL